MIEFKVLAMKTDTDNLHAIFLLKKNVWYDIIKTILGYLPIMVLDILKEWKVAITSVEQEYESTEECHDYKTGIGMTYRGQGQPMDIGKSNKNFKNGKSKCFNYNKYKHMAKNANWRRKNMTLENASNATKKGI